MPTRVTKGNKNNQPTVTRGNQIERQQNAGVNWGQNRNWAWANNNRNVTMLTIQSIRLRNSKLKKAARQSGGPVNNPNRNRVKAPRQCRNRNRA